MEYLCSNFFNIKLIFINFKLYFIPYPKINSKRIIDLNIKLKTTKLLEESRTKSS